MTVTVSIPVVNLRSCVRRREYFLSEMIFPYYLYSHSFCCLFKYPSQRPQVTAEQNRFVVD